jgi:hypothetical protein
MGAGGNSVVACSGSALDGGSDKECSGWEVDGDGVGWGLGVEGGRGTDGGSVKGQSGATDGDDVGTGLDLEGGSGNGKKDSTCAYVSAKDHPAASGIDDGRGADVEGNGLGDADGTTREANGGPALRTEGGTGIGIDVGRGVEIGDSSLGSSSVSSM